MARASRSKGEVRLMLSKEEANALTIAVALLNINDMDKEATEQGLQAENLAYNHNQIFNELTNITGLYPRPVKEVE